MTTSWKFVGPMAFALNWATACSPPHGNEVAITRPAPTPSAKVTPEESRPAEEPVAKNSVWTTIRAHFPDQAVGLFLDGNAVFAVGSGGEKLELLQGTYRGLVVDSAREALWLVSGWGEGVSSGYYLVDLGGELFSPTLVVPLPAGLEILEVSQEGLRVVKVEASPWATLTLGTEMGLQTHRDDYCRPDECAIAADSISLLEAVYETRRFDASRVAAIGSEFTMIEAKKKGCRGCGRFIPIPGNTVGLLSIRVDAHMRHAFWMLYDPVNDEYLSALDPAERSRGAPPDRRQVHIVHELFVCDGGGGMIVDGRFVDHEFKTIYADSEMLWADCLESSWEFREYDALEG